MISSPTVRPAPSLWSSMTNCQWHLDKSTIFSCVMWQKTSSQTRSVIQPPLFSTSPNMRIGMLRKQKRLESSWSVWVSPPTLLLSIFSNLVQSWMCHATPLMCTEQRKSLVRMSHRSRERRVIVHHQFPRIWNFFSRPYNKNSLSIWTSWPSMVLSSWSQWFVHSISRWRPSSRVWKEKTWKKH